MRLLGGKTAPGGNGIRAGDRSAFDMEETGMMRTKNVWLAILLTVGVAVVTNRAQAQEDVPSIEDPVVPLPLGHDRMSKGGFYVAGEFVYFRQTNPIRDQVVAVRGILDFDGSITADLNGVAQFPPGAPPIIIPGNPVPGTFYGSGTQALNTNQVSGPGSYEPGFRLTTGWRFKDGSAIEFSWLRLNETKYNAVASLVPESLKPGTLLEETFLFSPVFNFPSEFGGSPDKLAIGNPLAAFGIWNGANVMSLSFVQRTSIYDISYRIPIYDSEYCRCYGLVGGRYVQLWENFGWRTVSAEFDGTSGQDDFATYTNITSNNLWGADIGLGTEFFLGHGFAFSLDGRYATLLDFAREEAKYDRGDFAIGNKRSVRAFTVVPELQATANVWWYPFNGCQIRFGYDAMAFFNTYASEQPIDFNYGSVDPGWQKVNRYLTGFNAGVGFIF
jgi:hypothetical protein